MILDGSKVSDKIAVIKAVIEKADVLLIGGVMAYTFYKALGIPIGSKPGRGGQGSSRQRTLGTR